MAEVQWIKLYIDMFGKPKINKIRRLPDGDSILLFWVMLLATAGKCNAGGMIFITERVPFTKEDLADEFDFEISTIELALKAFVEFDMIDLFDDGFISVRNWEKYQNADRLLELREYNRLAKQKSREKQRLLKGVNDMSMTSQRCQDTEGEKDKDKDIKNIEEGLPPPTLAEVEEYVSERGGKIDTKRFYDFYTANGWKKSGGDPILDWRAVVQAWERTEFRKPEEPASIGSFDPEEFFAAAVQKSREKIGG